MPTEKPSFDSILEFVRELWNMGAVYVHVEDVDVQFGDGVFAEPTRLDDDPLPKTEDGYSFFFEGDFTGIARVTMTDQEAGFVRDMIREDAVEIVTKYLRRVRYGG